MKKTIWAVAIMAMAVVFSSPSFAQQTLRLGTEGAYPPFNFKKPDGTWVVSTSNSVMPYAPK